MIFYLTFADQPSGIFRSQVEDLVMFLNTNLHGNVKLVSFLSLRGFFKNRKLIKANVPEAIVLPMFPKLGNWRKNRSLLNVLCRLKKPQLIIARSVLATNLALDAREKGLVSQVIYDGRGAISAEWNEYDVVQDQTLKNEIHELESRSVMSSDSQIAVTSKLIDYWKKEFGFEGNEAHVIPCTLAKSYLHLTFSESVIAESRKLIGVKPGDVVLVYSGSTAGWQSIDELFDYLGKLIESQDNLKLLFLGHRTDRVERMIQEYPGKVIQDFVKPEEVPMYLMGCDYGLLIREDSVTNQVAAPVKFAEYLVCGLKVIASDNIGDYSEMIRSNAIGYLKDEMPNLLEKVERNNSSKNFAKQHFTKEVYLEVYQQLVATSKCK